MKKLLLALCLVAILSVSAFASSMTVGLSVSTLNNPFFVILRDGAIEQAKVLDVELVVMDAQNDPAKQVSDIEDLIQKKVDVILLNPTDADALVPAVEQANKAGIPLLTIDRSVNGGDVALHIASDNVKGGGMAAAYLVCLLYTSDAADEEDSVDLGGRRIIKKKKKTIEQNKQY